jgi:hypothetical protein
MFRPACRNENAETDDRFPVVCLTGVLSWPWTRLVASFLYGLTPNDPLTLSLPVALLAGVARLAGYLQACRASRLEPLIDNLTSRQAFRGSGQARVHAETACI